MQFHIERAPHSGGPSMSLGPRWGLTSLPYELALDPHLGKKEDWEAHLNESILGAMAGIFL